MEKNSYRASFTSKFVNSMLKRKNPDEMLAVAKSEGLEKTLGVWDLIVLGIGAIIGSGIFAVVGIAAAGGADSVGAGPALIVSMIIAAFVCVFGALLFGIRFNDSCCRWGLYIYICNIRRIRSLDGRLDINA